MAELGICINAANSVPDADECAALGLGRGDWVRTHVAGSLTLLDDVLERVPPDVNIMVTLNSECAEVGWDWSGWERACYILASKYAHRVKIVGCGNELDLWHWQPPVGEPDPRLTPYFAAELVRRAAPIFHDKGIAVAMSSVASGSWASYLHEMAGDCWEYADYADLHLYVKELNGVPAGAGWQTADAALLEAARISGMPVISSEAGIKVDDAGGLEAQAQWAAGLGSLPAELVCSWCWHDRMASPGETGGQAFGARGLNGERKPLWFALQNQFDSTGSHPPKERHVEFVEGFAKWARIEGELLGTPLRNERGVDQGWSTQPTSTGILNWVEGKGHCFTTHDGRIFRWQEDWAASREVP